MRSELVVELSSGVVGVRDSMLYHDLLFEFLSEIYCISLQLDHFHGLVQVLHFHISALIYKLHASICLDVTNEVYDVAELLFEVERCNFPLLILKDFDKVPFVEMVVASEIALDVENAQVFPVLLFDDHTLAILHVNHVQNV